MSSSFDFGDQRQGARSLDEGWRWAQDVSSAELTAELSAFVDQYGPENVDVGPGFKSALDHGVYVRDLDDLLNELKEDMLNFEMGHPLSEDDS